MIQAKVKTAPKSKCKNKKCEYKGMKFDSLKEKDVYLRYEMLFRVGKIYDLRRQVPYILIDKSKYGRAIKYIADIVYKDINTNTDVVIDVKSVYTAKMPVYRLKKRMFAERYGFEIVEVFE